MLNRDKFKMIKATMITLVSFLIAGNVAASKLDQATAIEKKTAVSQGKSQKKINRFAEQTLDMAADYKNTLRIVDQMKDYNASLERLIASQEKEMQSIQHQMSTIDATERGVVPLMNEMIASLEAFVKADIPFDLQKRLNRVDTLRDNMLRADVATSAKYRAILEAYQNEIAYGGSMSAYQAKLGDREVDFLRIGRVALLYLTLDGKEAGMWNQAEKKWTRVGDEYLRSIEEGIKMARKQATFNLIKLPVAAAKEAQ